MAEGAAQGITQGVAQGVNQGADHVLEMLHPMREPPLPASLLPFAVTLAVGCGVALVALALLIRARRRRADLREAALAALARTRALAPADRLAAQAALLRRLVRRLAGEGAARRQGQAWLESLDAAFATRVFTQGAGTAFGDALYDPRLPDVDALDETLVQLFRTLREPRGTSLSSGRERARPEGPSAIARSPGS